MATCGLGRNSVEPGSRRRRVGFTKSVTGGNCIAGNEGFTSAEGFTDAETATATCQYSVNSLSRVRG